MNWWKSFFRRPADAQLNSELSFHIDKLAEANIAAGMSPEEARRQAILEFGGNQQIKEECRDVHRIATVENTLSNAPDPGRWYLLRTYRDPLALASAVRQKIHQIEPNRSVYDIVPLEERIFDSLAENRFRTLLLTLFALTAISLACVGIYGSLSYFRQRAHP